MGEVINGLTVLGPVSLRDRPYWDVRCSCGKKIKPLREDSIRKRSKPCVCPLEGGTRSGKLTYSGVSRLEGKRRYLIVTCDCGRVFETRSDTFKLNKDGCGNHINPVKFEGGKAYLDISTETYKDTWLTVDEVDYPLIKDYHWWCVKGGYVLYAEGMVEGKQVKVHQILISVEGKGVVDHQDGDGLNNTRENIRTTDRVGNSRNTRILSNNTSGCTGVSYKHENGTWRAYITIGGKQKNLGHYQSKEEAVVARKSAEKRYGFHKNHRRAT